MLPYLPFNKPFHSIARTRTQRHRSNDSQSSANHRDHLPIRYFPKDQTIDGIQSGHRHDWEGTIVWVRSATSTTPDNILAVCPSQHGDWFCSTSPALSGSKPLLEYAARFPTNHALYAATTVGGTQPLVAWESLPGAAVTALQSTDFGSANVPFKDATFQGNLAEAAANF